MRDQQTVILSRNERVKSWTLNGIWPSGRRPPVTYSHLNSCPRVSPQGTTVTVVYSPWLMLSVSHTLRTGVLSPVYSNLTGRPGRCTTSPSSWCDQSLQSTERTLQRREKRHVFKYRMDLTVLMKTLLAGRRSWPCVVSWCWLCCCSKVWVASSRAESRLQQRGWSSLGGLMASSFSSSDAELRSAGFLSRARSRKERMATLQSSDTSSRGGACLCIC